MHSLRKLLSLFRPSQQLKTGAVVLGALASGNVDSTQTFGRLSPDSPLGRTFWLRIHF